MNIVPASELDSILRKSEAHALTCTIDYGNALGIFRRQIQPGFLTISATSKMVKQAIQVYELFLKRMFREGFYLILDCKVHFHCPASALVVNGEIIPIRVKETLSYTTSIDRFHERSRTATPSGKLALEIYGASGNKPSKVLMETVDMRWRDLFNNIVPYLQNASARLKKARLENEDWHRRMAEEWRKREEHEQMIKDRAKLAKSILEDIWLYKRADVIRKYCDMIERQGTSEAYMEKIMIARQFADWIDPTTDYVDELLSEKFDASDFL